MTGATPGCSSWNFCSNLILRPPLDSIALQLAFLGLLFAWSRLPIFGIPRKVEPPRLADFGQHVAALGELLEKTGDEQYARERLKTYHQFVRHDVPRNRLKTVEPAAPILLVPSPIEPVTETPTAADVPEQPSVAPPTPSSPS